MSTVPRRPSKSEHLDDLIEPLHQHVCGRIRELRQARYWTLEQLAKASGVSRSMLSQIERCEANPTLAVTFRIAQAFKLSLGDLCKGAFTDQRIEVVRGSEAASIFRNDRVARIRTLSPLYLEKDVEFYEVELSPGECLESPPHFQGTREFLTVCKGTVVVRSGEEEVTLRKSDSAQYPADVPHSIRNPTRQSATFFLVDIYAGNQ